MNVLVAEDSDSDFELIRLALQNAGKEFRIFRVRDGHEAMQYLAGERTFADRNTYPVPHIALFDIGLPGINGLEILAWLQSRPQHRVIPTIMLSASPKPEDIAKSYELGANTYFVKPTDYFHFQTLFRDIAAYWRHAQTPATFPV